MRDQGRWNAGGRRLVARPSECQGLGLGGQVGQQQVLVGATRVLDGSGHADQVARHHVGALVQPLEEGVLPVGAGCPPDHRSAGSVQSVAVVGDPLAEALHRELLQVGGQQSEPVGVGHHGHRRASQERPVPDVDEPEQHRSVPQRLGVGYVFVDEPHACQELGERRRPDGHHDRQPDRRRKREPAAHPLGQGEGHLRGHAEGRSPGRVRGDGHQVACRQVVAEPVGQPGAGALGRREGLDRGERLGAHHHQRVGRLQPGECGGQVGTVQVRGEAHREVGMRQVGQGVGCQRRSQVAAAYAQADHRGYRVSRGSPHAAVPDRGRQVGHPVQGGVHPGYHVDAIHLDHLVAGCTQGGVERREPLGCVDRLAVQHARQRGGHRPVLGQRRQQGEGLVGHLLAGRVDPEVSHLDSQACGPVGIVGEQVPERRDATVAVAGQGRPGGGFGRRAGHVGHSPPVGRRPWVIRPDARPGRAVAQEATRRSGTRRTMPEIAE